MKPSLIMIPMTLLLLGGCAQITPFHKPWEKPETTRETTDLDLDACAEQARVERRASPQARMDDLYEPKALPGAANSSVYGASRQADSRMQSQQNIDRCMTAKGYRRH